MLEGSCLCGAVTFRVTGSFSEIEVCHCVQCRKWTGHFFANIEVPRDSLELHGEERIAWYRSSTGEKGDYYDIPDDERQHAS